MRAKRRCAGFNLVLVLLVAGVHVAVRAETRRISEFLDGNDGWRIINSLRDAGKASGKVIVKSNTNPSYLVLSNDILFQVNSMQNSSTSLGLNITTKVPQFCLASDIECQVTLTLLGERCSLKTALPTPSRTSSRVVDLSWYKGASSDQTAATWTVCSMLLAPYGYCPEKDATSAMRAVMGTLLLLVMSFEVTCANSCDFLSFDFELESVVVLAQPDASKTGPSQFRFPDVVGHLPLTSFPPLARLLSAAASVLLIAHPATSDVAISVSLLASGILAISRCKAC
eukprot:767429-Hanusia_phi.AAC.1